MTINFKFYSVKVFTILVLYLYVQPSLQDLLQYGLEQGLSPDEIELIKNYRSHRYSRQANTDAGIYDASGIKQAAECGINSHSTRRKRDGEPQGTYDWPWMAVLLESKTYLQFCGGALINHQYVLTAAHCFAEPGQEKTKDDVIVRLGEWDLYDPDETKYKDVYVAEVKVHEDYDSGTKHNDIALLKLDRSVDYTQYIRPICLPSLTPEANKTTIVAGWGAVKSGGEHSAYLLDVSLPVVGHADCAEAFASGSSISEDLNICAGGEVGKDSCQGDSGGPLVHQEDGKRWVTVGIVSWGQNCGEYTPGVYTNVKSFLNWIGKRVLDASP